MSAKEETKRKTRTKSREIDLMKIQIYSDRCHTKTTLGFSFAFVYFSLVAIFYGVFYQGLMTLNSLFIYTGLIGIVTILITSMVVLVIFRYRYSKDLETLSKLLERVREGRELPLPPLNELIKEKEKKK